jgi:hypothetical protein
MCLARRLGAASLLLAGLLGNAPAVAQDLMLTEACEQGFRRLIQMAQNGRLGEDVTNANVGVEKVRVRVELVRAGAPSKLVWLRPKSSTPAFARFFDVAAGDGATESDLLRVGRALDEIFTEDPFVVAGFRASPGGSPIADFTEAWTHGGWTGVLGAFERRMMALVSVQYTVGIILVLAIGLAASLALLWGSAPRR